MPDTTFETVLAGQLREYAEAGVRPVDRRAIAQGLIADGRRRRVDDRWSRLGWRRSAPRSLAPVWATIALLGLLIALLGAALLAGGRPDLQAVVPPLLHVTPAPVAESSGKSSAESSAAPTPGPSDGPAARRLILVSGSDATCLMVDALSIADGARSRLIDCADRVVVTPDGARAAIGGHGVRIIDLRDGSQLGFIDTGADNGVPVAWSPDGRWLQWVGCEADKVRRCKGVIGSPDSAVRNPVPEPADGGYWGDIMWSSDGSRVIVPTGDGSLIGNGDGSGLTALPNGAPLAWSADGSQYIYGRGEYIAGHTRSVDAWQSAEDGSAARNLTHFAPGGFAHAAAWSPDGRTLAIVRGIRGEDGTLPGSVQMAGDLWLVDPDGSVRKVALPEDLASLESRLGHEMIRWSPDGSRLAIESGVGDAGSSVATYIVPINEAPVVVLRDAARPAWSPDGRSILMIGRTGTAATIDIANADGSDRHAVGDAPTGDSGQVFWAP